MDSPFRMIVAESPSASGARAAADAGTDPSAALAEAVEAAAARAGEPVLVVPEGDQLIVLATDGGAAVAACG
jgi:purine catabolism regulator